MQLIDYKNKLIYPLILLILFIISGVAVQYLPAEPADTNIAEACEVFRKDGLYPAAGSRISDNYTDAVMLLISKTDSQEVKYKKFFTSPLYTVKQTSANWKDLYPLDTLCKHGLKPVKITYSRYWHGYQVVLKPLLHFLNYGQIRDFNLYLQFGLFVIMLWLMWLKRTYGLILGWILSYLILNPLAMSMNMTYSIAYYIAVFASILVFTLGNKIEKRITWPIFFMMVGMSICYFDFLTYPVATIGVPLTILFYLNPPKNTKEMLENLILCVMFWGIGYVGMWIMRWILCALLTDINILKDALGAVDVRMNVGYQYPFYIAVLITLNELLLPFDMRMSILVIFILSFIALYLNKNKCEKFWEYKYFQVLPFFLISLGSPMYCLLVRSHPLQHAPYTYRLWIVFFFAFISGLNFWVLKAREEFKNKEIKND